MEAEQPFQLAGVDAQHGGDLRPGTRVIDPRLHHFQRANQMGVADPLRGWTETRCSPLAAAHGIIDHLISHRDRQVIALIAFDQVQHQVCRRAAARSGHKLLVRNEDVADQFDERKLLREAIEVFPVNRRTQPVKPEDVRPCLSCNQMCWGRRSHDYRIS